MYLAEVFKPKSYKLYDLDPMVFKKFTVWFKKYLGPT